MRTHKEFLMPVISLKLRSQRYKRDKYRWRFCKSFPLKTLNWWSVESRMNPLFALIYVLIFASITRFYPLYQFQIFWIRLRSMVESNGFVMTSIASYSRHFACSSFIPLAVMKMTRVTLNASISQRARSASSPSIPGSLYPGQTSRAPFLPPTVPPNLQHHRSSPWNPPRISIARTPIS